MQFMDIKNGRFYLGDCLEVMKEIPDGVIDMLLVDLPYGTTACSWDSVIPFDRLWEQYNRICKENAAMVFTASQPFTTALIASNIDNFKYSWVWEKNNITGFMQAKTKPLKSHEDILVFGRFKTAAQYFKGTYNPQCELKSKGVKKYSNARAAEHITGNRKSGETKESKSGYPKDIIKINIEKGFHPTQKPVELFEYLIRTYTNEGDLVLDNTAGSGTTAIAAENTGRKWVCIEQSKEYATKAVERIWNHEATPQEAASEVKIESDIPIPEGE
tara:strand:+ start:24644 stop:25462 length:819 start_codon:yes stop_codon:yes gene_type:complete